MRKFTALTVALSLSATGQAFTGEAFAGPPHAPAAHAPAAHAPAAHPHATSEAGTSHTPTGQALHAVENKATTVEAEAAAAGIAPGTYNGEAVDEKLQTARADAGMVVEAEPSLTGDLVAVSTAERNYKANSNVISVFRDVVDTALVAAGGTPVGMSSSLASDSAPTAQDDVSLEGVGEAITAGSYIGGIGFGVSAVLKFKEHKDNPTQVPVGEPVELVAVAAALLFLPSMLSVVGNDIYYGTAGATEVPGTTITVN